MNSVVAIVIGSFLSLTAFIRPDVGIRWIFLTAVLAVGTITYFLPQFNNVSWGVGASGVFLIIISLFHFLSKNHTSLDRVTVSLFFFVVFLSIPIIANINYPLQTIASGKNILQYWGFVTLATLGYLHLNSRNKIVKLVIIIVIIQAVVSIYQAMFIVDWGNRLYGGDSVVGTFGGTPEGGGSSGAQTIFLTVVITIALTAYISNQLKISLLIPLLIVSLIPVSLNETKVFFVLLPIALIYLFITGFKRFPSRTLQVTAIGFGLVVIIFAIYFVYLQQMSARDHSKTVSEYTDRMQKSNMGFYIGEGREASNSRLGSILFWWGEQVENGHTLELLVGHGLGASKSGGLIQGRLSEAGSAYYGLMLDKTGLSYLLWDIGIVGTVLFFLIFVSAWSLARKTRLRSYTSTYDKSLLWGIECGIIILALSNIYDKYFFTNPALNAFTLLIFSFVVGIIKSSQSVNTTIMNNTYK
ncbi:MAG: hypothetical protein ABW098_15640 [Candidatus Thiodiazotropha sp.]